MRNSAKRANQKMAMADWTPSRKFGRPTYKNHAPFSVPVKWHSPESLRDRIYTVKSDVWSYGICLWELVTMGRQPYPGVEPEKMLRLLEDGYRMDRPANCSQQL